MTTLKEFALHVADLCEQAGCKEKIAKLHHEQSLRGWHPHPPQGFVNWWTTGGAQSTEKATNRAWLGIDVTRAYNCKAARDTYLEAKEIGATT